VERGGQGDAPVGTLVVLEDRDQRPSDRRRDLAGMVFGELGVDAD